MSYYLLFDSGCGKCSKLAQAVQKITGVQAVNLRGRQARAWLEKVYPDGYKWRPYLVQVNMEGDVKAYSGAGMAAKLANLCGPQKAMEALNVMRR